MLHRRLPRTLPIAFALMLVLALVAACGGDEEKQTSQSDTNRSADTDQDIATETNGTSTTPDAESEPTVDTSGLQVIDIEAGTGEAAEAGDTITVHYTGYLSDGEQFDSSIDREPFTIVLGVGQVIAGWDQGLVGMKVGGKRRLIIPPELGYGAEGFGEVIPPDAELTFEVELLDVQ